MNRTVVPDPEAGARPVPDAGEVAASVRGEAWLRRGEVLGQALDRLLHRALPPALNPFSQLGAVANTCFLVALASGILLLFWYSPSVHQAWKSLDAMRAGSAIGTMARSVHRYSSDACVLFILLHAVRMFLARRFAGPRWLAWSTGIALLALVWAIGWSGYWLVWDVGAQHAALGTARFIDRLPVLAEPMSRSFLSNEGVPSLLFFVVFFAHMLGPLGVGVGLWIHLQRVNRARLLAGRPLTLWICGSLAAVSLLAPATSGPAADMLHKADGFALDAWFLWPVALTDRLGGGLLWLLFLGGGLLATTVPWTWVRRRAAAVPEGAPGLRVAAVDLARCFGCTLCAKDCPFNAITMVPRGDGRKFQVQSAVDPDLCVSCGVCAGACDSEAIGLPAFDTREVGRRVDAWLAADAAAGTPSSLALLCAGSAGAGVRVDAEGRSPDLPGYRVCRVPCVGWISSVLVERAFRNGAPGVLVGGCAEGDPNCREGVRWLRDRLDGRREPALNPARADRSRVLLFQADAASKGSLLAAARAFRTGVVPAAAGPVPRARMWAGGLALACVLGAATWAGSRVPYRTPHDPRPMLLVSFNHGGDRVGQKALSKEDAARRLPHMRTQANLTRERVPVRLRVSVDGREVHRGSHVARGFSHDGPSLALEQFPLEPGRHEVVVEIADTAEDRWTRRWSGTLEFTPKRNRLVQFDTRTGFTAH